MVRLVWLSMLMLPLTVFGQLTYDIDCRKSYQTIDNFGASDAWTCHYLGEFFPDSVRCRVADLLFSRELNSDGSPLGIGLSLWRFNIGGGSMDNPRNIINSSWRVTECLMDSTGHYDFHNKQRGQIWFMKAAKERGCEQLLGFCNSPPWYMTRNGQAVNHGRDGRTLNLDSTRYGEFANFLASVWHGLRKQHGITLDYISPLNEPEWDWTGLSQEGTPCSVDEMSRLFSVVSSEFKQRKVKAKLLATESGEYSFMYKNDTDRPWVDNQIERLYSPQSQNYIGNLYGVTSTVAGHSYWTGHKERLESTRRELWSKVQQHGLRLWQSELCIMSNDGEIGGGVGRDMTMKTALYVARIIHYDLTVANASSWQWWTAISPEDYRDGIVFIDKNHQGTPNVYVPKLLWAFGNYSRFIRPGAKRVDVAGDVDMDGVMVSSFVNKDKTLVTVAINYSPNQQSITLKTDAVKGTLAYLTSDGESDNLRCVGSVDLSETQSLPARSITTYVSKLK